MMEIRKTITTKIKVIYRKNKNSFIGRPLSFLLSCYRFSFVSLSKMVMDIKRMKLQASFKKVLKTGCFECDPAAKTEVHSLICHRYLNMSLTAIKSLLRFHSSLAVILHDDGSLTDDDTILLRSHIKGVCIISKADADEKIFAMLQKYPNCRKYRGNLINSLQLFDFALLSNTGKIIAMDSDVLFFQPPARLIDWIQNNTKEIIYYVEESPLQQKEFLLKFGYTNYNPNFCFGFVCFHKEVIDLETIESVLSKIDTMNWVLNQNVFAILMNNISHEYPRCVFDKNTYQDITSINDGKIFRHYKYSWLSTEFEVSNLLDVYREDVENVLSKSAKLTFWPRQNRNRS